ncbi:hydrogenase maturation nickel metallochaperone HypA [Polyangium spumosum]|uniref:Hydrogenase maturation factor HypA n=1 Tax=Polyangium spumosum TaxID=889282 RepID=A0A6N7PP74_9BACT|nr:hydrogenase maturation nickel metallochaperone HypA [Polyangium spumosum]MRG93729.1 hydrogenase maturation nickel metallochaperone HypA [Polyangium spumosum]
MHESSLGKEVLRLVLARADEEGAARVCAVRGWIAETERLAPEAIAFHFEAHARGTKAEGARLDLALRWVEAECKTCRSHYRPEHHLLLCPACGSTEGTVLGETGLAVEAIEVE